MLSRRKSQASTYSSPLALWLSPRISLTAWLTWMAATMWVIPRAHLVFPPEKGPIHKGLDAPPGRLEEGGDKSIFTTGAPGRYWL